MRLLVLVLAGAYTCLAAAPIKTRAEDIVQESVKNMDANWQAAPHYDFTERDVTVKPGVRTLKIYDVQMIDGSTYSRLVAVNGQPLSAPQSAAEARKLQQEIARRLRESPEARKKRVAEYQKERRQDHAMFTEMTKAFDYKLTGEQTVNGRRCFVLQATPKTGYVPRSRETAVLKGMRGTMWVDADQYQWVKVHAEVFRPVSFGLFFASVKPGTEFTLEQKPVAGSLWLPSHFTMKVNARVVFWSRRSTDDETYWNYHPASH